MPDFGILLDPPLPSAPEESLSSSLALISCPNLEVSCESDTQMQELVSDRNSQLGFPILMKEDELKPENNGCVELVQKEDELKQLTPKSSDSDIQMQEIVSDRNSQLGFPSLLKEDELKLLTPKSSESDTQMQELVFDRNSQLGFPILLKEDELKPENNECVELEQKEDELKLLTPKSSESDTQMQEMVSDRNSQLGFPILLKEDELKLENNGCVELEQKEDESKLLISKSSEADTQMQVLVSDGNSQLGFPILLKEDELNPENNECVELEQKGEELKLLISKSSDSDTQIQVLVSDRESQLALPILLKEDELKPENNGCVELEQKDELKLENNGCGELGIRVLIPKSSQSITQIEELVSDPNSQRGFPILPKEDELKLENNGYGELGIRDLISKSSQSDTQMQELVSDQNSQLGFSFLQKEELKPDNNGCVELEQKDDKLKLENNGCGVLGISVLITKSSESDTQMQELVSDRNPQLGFPNLQIEDELKPDNNGCIELEQKEDQLKLENNGSGDLGIRGLRSSGGGSVAKKSLDEFVKDWVERKVNAGVDKRNCVLPFLIHAPKLVECSVCQGLIFPGDEVECSVRDCMGVFHLECAKERLGLSSPKMFKCPQHVCYVCNKKIHLWRCIRCPLASHDKCAAFPEHVVHLNDQPGRVICWKHPSDWRMEKEILANLPVPYVEEEFKIDINWKDMIDNRSEPPPYVHIKRNAYLIKKKRDGVIADIGCTHCKSTECSDNCVCRVQCISCSKACRCSDMCSNRPFRRDRKIQVVKTELCGWGVVASESINKGDFIIEYIGEVIDDALCEKRLWDMKYKGVQNFYMCELRKDFTIDATFKGNLSRFLNHSCEPNCKLEKWQVEGETRVGVFAARYIEVGEPLTYDYRFVQFGSEVKCHCGASNCQGYLGSKKKITSKLDISWGSKRKRTSTSCLAIVKLNSF
ncbi:uncharacterized protein LOC107026384 isoform X2 [Solanum pennellii]|uniref:Uncharacterized protein LOC107026384 isoform X2 n=1 Tax=Solanum pennellii TaxID=28526 RepID=A0ABM1VF78_SOLPN|nr:uncharacterized protein LOC107026384 isoform X2 [Solanum pennellii]